MIKKVNSDYPQHPVLKVLSTEHLELKEKFNSEHQLNPGLKVLSTKHLQMIKKSKIRAYLASKFEGAVY